jgi:superfamily I DNA/RNA helicase
MGYQKYLSGANKCSPSLYPLPIKDLFDLVVVDEAQDLSYCQLSNLNSLAKQSNIVFFLGEHQLLFDVKSKLNFIKSIYHEQKVSLSELILSHSYRCPSVVVQLANCIIQTKYQATGGLSDEIENPRIEVAPQFLEKAGEVRWISPEDPILQIDIKLHAKNHYLN